MASERHQLIEVFLALGLGDFNVVLSNLLAVHESWMTWTPTSKTRIFGDCLQSLANPISYETLTLKVQIFDLFTTLCVIYIHIRHFTGGFQSEIIGETWWNQLGHNCWIEQSTLTPRGQHTPTSNAGIFPPLHWRWPLRPTTEHLWAPGESEKIIGAHIEV